MDARTWGRWWRLVGRSGLVNVLTADWDPIGLGRQLPRDEYAAVSGPVATLLRRSASIDQIAQVLSEHRVTDLGLTPDADSDRRAAGKLVAWYDAAIRHANIG